MNKANMNYTSKPIRAVACALALSGVLTLTGCGGGGSSVGSTSKTLVGALLDANNAPLSGDTVVYDIGTPGSQTTVTNAQGQYRLTIPQAAVTGSDTLTFLDTAGRVIDIAAVTLDQSTVTVSTTTAAPPVPPVQSL